MLLLFLFYDPEKETFEFGRHEHSVELAEKIIKAIKDYCVENGIPLAIQGAKHDT